MEKTVLEIAFYLKRISLLRRIATQQASAKAGIYISQLPLLGYVSHHPGCTQKDVADHLQVSPPNITAMVKRMVKTGLVEKKADPQNLRRNSLFITPLGQDTLSRSAEVFEEIDRKMFSGFSPEELRLLHSYTQRLLENVTSQEFRNATHFSLMALLKKMEDHAEEDLP